MERLMKPVAVVTTIQPYLLAWVVAITFFVSLTLVAVISRGRSLKQFVGIFVVCFFVLLTATTLSTRWVVDIHVVDVEFIRAGD